MKKKEKYGLLFIVGIALAFLFLYLAISGDEGNRVAYFSTMIVMAIIGIVGGILFKKNM